MAKKSKEPRNLPVGLQLGFPTSNINDQKEVRLRIEDGFSGWGIVEISLSPAQFRSLMSGTYTRVMAEVAPEEVVSRIGLARRVQSVDLGYSYSEESEAQARKDLEAEGYEDIRKDRTNRGEKLTGFKYVTPSQDDIDWKTDML